MIFKLVLIIYSSGNFIKKGRGCMSTHSSGRARESMGIGAFPNTLVNNQFTFFILKGRSFFKKVGTRKKISF